MAHYLVDLFANPVSSAPITSVNYPQNGETILNGSFVVKVPDGVPVVPPPTSLSDLLAKKRAGLLAYFAGYANLVTDDLIDASDVDMTVSTGMFGERSVISLPPNGAGVFQSTMVPLVGSAPPYAVVTWDLWEAVDDDPANGRATRKYKEIPSSPSYATASVSFDNGVTFNAVTNGTVFFIPALSQGTQLIFRLTNVHATKRIRLGSWAVLY